MRIAGHAFTPALLVLLGACAAAPEAPQGSQVDPEGSGVDASEEHAGGTPSEALATQGGRPEPMSGAGTVAPQDEREQLEQDVKTLTLEEQVRKLLVEDRLDKAEILKQNGRFEEALHEVELALETDEGNPRARKLYAEIGALTGRIDAERLLTGDAVVKDHVLKIERTKSEAQDYLNRGKIAMGRGDYDTAINELSLAQTLIRTIPYSIDWNKMDEEVDELLERSYADRTAAQEREIQAERAQAFEDLKASQAAEEQRQAAVTAALVSQGTDAFDKGEYDQAMEYADLALERDARNEMAEELRQAAFRAGREKVRESYIVEKREEFARWREHLDELRVPWETVLTLPNREDWRRLTEIRSGRKGYDLEQTISPGEIALRAQLASTPVRLPGIDGEESLSAVIDIIRDYTGLPLVVDPAAETLMFDEAKTITLDLPNEVSVQQALNLVTAEAGDQVTWTIRHDAVLVTTKERARGKPKLVNHDVQDLIMVMTDFTGPRIERLRLLDELDADEDGGGPFGGILAEAKGGIEIDELADLIQRNVEPDTWEDEGVRIEPGEGYILIAHAPEVQAQVRAFLEDLRRFNTSLVTIESKFLTVGDNWIQQIGADLRGLDSVDVSDVTNGLEDMAGRGLDNGGSGSEGEGAAGPPSAGFYFDDGNDGDFSATVQNFFGSALGNSINAIGGLAFQMTFFDDAEVSLILQAVEKQTQFEIVNSQILSVHNTQRAYVTVINQQAYIQDFDVEVAQFQAVADPQINVLHEGVVLDVRPTIHHDRKTLTLEVQPTIAKVVNLRTFSTTLGGNTAPVDFQLPELEVQSVNTSAILPDGGSILLGGLSSVRNIERRAEVPWIARIPVLGFLFKQEGYNDERRSLMILIRASIYDIRQAVEEKLERKF